MIFTNEQALANEILRRCNGPSIIAIDGWTGVGKTTLSNRLAALTSGSSFDVDEALNENQDCYVAALRLGEIRTVLEADSALLFLSGICLREVLDQLACDVTRHLYVKRMAQWGWADEDELDGVIPGVPGSSRESLRAELRAYHSKWRPHQHADYEFHWYG